MRAVHLRAQMLHADRQNIVAMAAPYLNCFHSLLFLKESRTLELILRLLDLRLTEISDPEKGERSHH
jgi:hypothetical protein